MFAKGTIENQMRQDLYPWANSSISLQASTCAITTSEAEYVDFKLHRCIKKKAMHYKHTKAIIRHEIKESSSSDDKCKPCILKQMQ